MKFLGLNKVICLSPHPDDVEYSMSGTIKKYKDTNFVIIYMTYGTATDISSTEKRYIESDNFWKLFNNVNVIKIKNMTFGNATNADWVTKMDDILQQNEYDCIMSTSNKDSHQEHVFVNQLMQSICRHNMITMIEYKSPSTLHEWIPNLFVEIDKNMFEEKLLNLQTSFISQMDSKYFTKKLIKMFHRDYITMKRGSDYTEQFNIKTIYK